MGGDFRTKLLELSSSIFVLYVAAVYVLVKCFKVPNGNNSVLHLRQNQGSSFPLRYWQSIKFRLHLICTHKLHLSQYRELSLSPIVLIQILHGKVIVIGNNNNNNSNKDNRKQ